MREIVTCAALALFLGGSGCGGATSARNDDAGPGPTSDAGDTEDAGDAGGSDAGDSPDAGHVAGVPDPRVIGLEVSTGALSPAFASDVLDYSISSLNSLRTIEVTATGNSDAAFLSINGAAAWTGHPVALKLAPLQDIAVVARAWSGESRTYVVHYLPTGFPSYRVQSSPGHGDEAILITPHNSSLLMVGRDGSPLYYRWEPGVGFGNFQRFDFESGAVYAYERSDPAWPTVPGQFGGVDALMDPLFNERTLDALQPAADHPALAADIHDFLLLGDQHYIALSYSTQTVDLSSLDPTWSAQAPVMANHVQEVDHGAVLLEWRNTDHPSLYFDSVDGHDYAGNALSDYTHLNSIDVDPADGNLLLSLRHTNSVLKIDRTTGATIWTLGGASDDFGLTPDQLFSHQHHVKVQADGSLLMFDNGNGAHQTRVLSFTLDEAARAVASFRVVYQKPDDLPSTDFMGSAFWLGSTRYLIGWGGWFRPVASPPPSVTEIVDGAPVWSLTFDSPTTFSYRAVPVANP
jgi:hypothetical protein